MGRTDIFASKLGRFIPKCLRGEKEKTEETVADVVEEVKPTPEKPTQLPKEQIIEATESGVTELLLAFPSDALVAGTFSDWAAQGPETRILARRGERAEFKFLRAGEWLTSPEYPTTPNPFGTLNNVITL